MHLRSLADDFTTALDSSTLLVLANKGTRQNRGILYAKAGMLWPHFWRKDAEISVFSDDFSGTGHV
jgi:hypothetical protein